MKLVRLLLAHGPDRLPAFITSLFYGPDRAQRSITFPSFLNFLTNRNIPLIYSVTICERRIVYGQRASNINYSTFVFNFDVAGFHNQSLLL